MADFDIQIKGGTVVDGTRVPRYRADVWIKDGKIAQIGGRAPGFAKKVIDADGLIVAPGFVDLHTHYDAQIRWDPYCTISGWHGVTSVVLGNCGFGFVPVKPDFRERSMLTMTRTEAIPYESMKVGMKWDWETIPQYLDSLDRAAQGRQRDPVHADLVADDLRDGPRRREDRGPPPRTSATRCARLLAEGMDAGLSGFSIQRLGPIPRRPTSTARRWSPTRCATRTSSTSRGCCASATRASSRSRRRPGTSRTTSRSSSGSRLQANRPILHNAIAPARDDPKVHQRSLAWLQAMPREGSADFRSDRDAPHRLRLHARTLEPLRCEPGVARRHHRHQRRENRQDEGPRAARGDQARARRGQQASSK